MIDGALIFIGGMIFGAPIWFSLAWQRFCRTERPKIDVRVTPELVSAVSQQTVMAWLDQRGLVWMPKGKEFRYPERKAK